MTALDNGLRFQQTATNATLAVATQTGQPRKRSYITDIAVSSDKADSVMLIKDDTTVIWQRGIGVGTFAHAFATPLTGSIGADISVTVDGTAAAYANVAGVVL